MTASWLLVSLVSPELPKGWNVGVVGDAQICGDLLDCTVGRVDILIGRNVVPYDTPHPAAAVVAAIPAGM